MNTSLNRAIKRMGLFAQAGDSTLREIEAMTDWTRLRVVAGKKGYEIMCTVHGVAHNTGLYSDPKAIKNFVQTHSDCIEGERPTVTEYIRKRLDKKEKEKAAARAEAGVTDKIKQKLHKVKQKVTHASPEPEVKIAEDRAHLARALTIMGQSGAPGAPPMGDGTKGETTQQYTPNQGLTDEANPNTAPTDPNAADPNVNPVDDGTMPRMSAAEAEEMIKGTNLSVVKSSQGDDGLDILCWTGPLGEGHSEEGKPASIPVGYGSEQVFVDLHRYHPPNPAKNPEAAPEVEPNPALRPQAPQPGEGGAGYDQFE